MGDFREGGQVWEVKRVGEREGGRDRWKERGREKNVLDCAHIRFSAYHTCTLHTHTHANTYTEPLQWAIPLFFQHESTPGL